MTTPYVEVWDPNTPQGSESRALGDDRIREFKRALEERLRTLCDFPTGNPLQLNSGVVGQEALLDNSVSTRALQDGSVTNSKLANASITQSKLDTDFEKILPSLSIFEVTAGKSNNHNGNTVNFGASLIQLWSFTSIPGVVPRTDPVGAAPGQQGTVVTLNVISTSTGSFDSESPTEMLALLNWTLAVTPFKTPGAIDVYATLPEGTSGAVNIKVTPGVTFRFGILNLLNPQIAGAVILA